MLWKPEYTPPQMSEDTITKIDGIIRSSSLTELFDEGLTLFSLRHKPLEAFVKNVVFERPEDGNLDVYSRNAFRIGAIITAAAYTVSGFDNPVDDTVVAIGRLDAELEGIPGAFLASFHEDLALQDLIELISAAPEMQHDLEHGSYQEPLRAGAGCTRLFLKYALVDAA